MIIFNTIAGTRKILREINNCIYEMIDFELYYYDEDREQEFLESYFPSHLCRENSKKCMDILIDLKEWTLDEYLHDLTCLHEYALYKIFNSYFDCAEDLEKESKGEMFKFDVNLSKFVEEDNKITKELNKRTFYTEDLFEDLDFMQIEILTTEYQLGNNLVEAMGVNLSYYLELMPKDVRIKIEHALKQKENDDETLIINQIKNVIKIKERYPARLKSLKEQELSEDIRDMLFINLGEKGIIIEREARGGYSAKEVGENDFFIYKIDNRELKQIAIGENKIWNNFEKQIKQLVGYMNEKVDFGFTIVFNKSKELSKVKDKQIEILQKLKYMEGLNVVKITEYYDYIVSVHMNPETDKIYKIYHFIINAYHLERENLAKESRKKKSK